MRGDDNERVEDRFRGLTASLTLVVMAALLVAFDSSFKRRSAQEERVVLERQVEELSHVKRDLEEKVRWAEGKYAHTLYLGKRLNQALLEEQARSRALKERLQERGPAE